MLYIVVFEIDGCERVRVFTDIKNAARFKKENGGNIHAETLNRGINELSR